MKNKGNLQFKEPSFFDRIRSMLGVDLYRLFHTPLLYIFLGIAAIIPAMILGTMGMENPQTGAPATQLYSNTWHLIAAVKPLYAVSDIAEYAKDAVETLTAAGIINGMGDGVFAPCGTVTRAQAAKVVYGLLNLIGGGK